MGRLKLIAIAGGIALIAMGVQEWRLASATSTTPQVISCSELAAKGPGSNAYVTLKDFLLCEQSYVYESSNRFSKKSWSKVWIPAVPLDGEYVNQLKSLIGPDGTLQVNGALPTPTDIRVLVKSKKVKNEGDLGPLSASGTITGLITNKIESLGSKERKILQESYPGIDFSRCYILDHDRSPAGVGQVAGMMGGGLVLSIAGAAWTLAGWKKSS